MFWRKPFFANVVDAEEFHTEAININNSDMTEIVVDESQSHAEIVAEENHSHGEIVAGDICTSAVSYTHLRAHETPEHRGWRRERE